MFGNAERGIYYITDDYLFEQFKEYRDIRVVHQFYFYKKSKKNKLMLNVLWNYIFNSKITII